MWPAGSAPCCHCHPRSTRGGRAPLRRSWAHLRASAAVLGLGGGCGSGQGRRGRRGWRRRDHRGRLGRRTWGSQAARRIASSCSGASGAVHAQSSCSSFDRDAPVLVHRRTIASRTRRRYRHSAAWAAIGNGRRPRAIGAARYSTVGVMVIGSFAVCFGSGIVTSSTPSCVRALIFSASTPSGSGMLREKLP